MTFIFILLGLLPSFTWLVFFLREDIHPEPKKMIALVFFYGAFVTIIATALEIWFRNTLKTLAISQYDFRTFLIFSAIEEILKFSVAYLAVSKSKYFDEPVDAMIYMITAALGFALVENVAVAASSRLLSEVMAAVVLRFVGATLLHSLSSAIVGYHWALGLIKRNARKLWAQISIGIVFASILHAIFNYLIISLQDILVYPTIFLISISLFVFWDFEKIKST